MDIIHFLKKYINKTENIKELLSLYLKRGNYEFASLFWKKNNTKYYLIDHIHTNIESDYKVISLSPSKNINSVFISTHFEGYEADFPIHNIIIIPIHVCTDVIGVLCLGNKNQNIKEEDIDEVTDLLSLTQVLVNKFKLIEDYKKIYSDSTYFSKDLFLANMSHEIRTPLNGIVGFNQLLMNTELSEQQKEYLFSMNHCSIQLMQIINDIIDFSKLSSGNMELNNDCVSIKEIMNNVYETLKNRINIKKHKYSIVIDNTVPDFIVIDKQKLTQIIINLLSNSINYTLKNGSISINISNTTNILQISVTDNGIGISEQNKCKLFNSFSQIENSLTKTGTGLGLAISKRLVELLGGKINVKSSLGKGSTFYFTCKHFPMKDIEDELKRDSKLLENKYILVVDDNPDNRLILSDMLFEWKMNPILCASGKEALKYVSANRYDFELGLLDICMPNMNGVELSNHIKTLKPLFPLIGLSSATEFINTSNFDSVLPKPINKLQLFNIIHKIVTLNTKDSSYIGTSDTSSYIPSGTSYIPNRKSSNNLENKYFNKNVKILIAEDISYNQTLIHNIVTSLGYDNVTVVSDGQETIEIIDDSNNKGESFDILLLDLRMPRIDGYEVIEHIKKKGYPLPKIVVVTASVLKEDINKCHDMGVEYFITKPIDIKHIKNVLLKLSKS
jgi:signal transduction histidine kinase/DNA-binding response OmpR family regulator